MKSSKFKIIWQNFFVHCQGSNPGWNDCHPQTLPLGHGCIYKSCNFDSIQYVQALTNLWKYSSTHLQQGTHLHMMEDCILLSQDLQFSRGACFAWHIMSRQLLNPDHENLGEGLRKFSGMCTLCNCIFQSFSLKCCLCEFVPWLNLKKNYHRCIVIYTTGNDNIFIFLTAATAHYLLLPIITYYYLFWLILFIIKWLILFI